MEKKVADQYHIPSQDSPDKTTGMMSKKIKT